MPRPSLTLHRDARLILRRAWSVRLAALSALFSALGALEPKLPFLAQYLSPGTMTMLASLCAVGVVGARVMAQANLPEH